MNNEPPVIPGVPSLPPHPPARKKGLPVWLKVVIVLVVCFFGFLGFRAVQFVRYMSDHPRTVAPGEAAFREANRQIISNKGTVGLGNTAEAVTLAQEYSRNLKKLRDEQFTKGKAGALSISKGEFLTYCQWNGDSCVFLVHVPELRRFTPEARESLNELAWSTAQSVLAARQGTPPKTVAVGLKGAMLYERIMIGSYVARPQKEGEGIQTSTTGLGDLQRLYPFFMTKEEQAQPGN